jgi:hypothetical protein
MDNYFQKDDRIEADSTSAVLEKKIHYLMTILSNQGMLLDEQGYNIGIPDDMETGQYLVEDATEVMRSKKNF